MSNNIFFERGQMADKPNNYLWNGDCLELMKDIPDKSIDAIICDLPYGYINRSNVVSWDNEIDLTKLWIEYERIIKDTGAIVLTSSQPFTSKLIISNLKLFKQEIIWLKKDSADFVNAKNRHLKAHENILLFSKGNIANGCKNKITYNPQGLIEKNKTRKVCKKDNTFLGKRDNQNDKEYVQKYTNYPMSYFYFNRNDNGKKNIHKTQKPISLMEYLVKTYTNENDWILDNTCGSNTTGIACYDLNRNYIGIEKDIDIYNVAKKRVEKNILLRANKQETLFKDKP